MAESSPAGPDQIDPLSERFSSADPPATLWHYTRRAALLSMLEKRCIWASSARHLNDTTELEWAFERVQELAQKEQNAFPAIKPLLTNVSEIVIDKLREGWDVFVFSLSQESDQLSQWRAYTSGADGYSIGFDTTRLQDFAKASLFHLVACEYLEENQDRLVRDILSDVEAEFVKQRQGGAQKMDAYGSATDLFVDRLIATVPVLKHPAFKEENEWRLIQPLTSIWNDRVKFRDGGKHVIPYLPMEREGEQLPIREVTIGPTPHLEIERRTLSGLLTVHGLKDATVTPSDVPFRDW